METKVKKIFLPVLLMSCILMGCSALNGETEKTKPEVEYIGTASTNTIVMTVRAVWVEHGVQVPYVKQKGDTIRKQNQHRFIVRDGKEIGCQAGKAGDLMLTPDRLYGESLNMNLADDLSSYSIAVKGSKEILKPVALYRKSKPVDCTRPPSIFGTGMEHTIVLKLDQELEQGKTYTIETKEGLLSLDKHVFTFDPSSLRSEAVHVNQVGFRPDDPGKLAFLSFWMGSGGNLQYPEGIEFLLLDDKTGKPAFTGKAKLASPAGSANNKTFADVHDLDFSEFKTPGTYRIMVDGVGCSFPFEIKEDAWTNAFIKSMRGLYFQRSGVALGPPYTEFVRPRGFHPDDGVKIYTSEPGTEGEDPSIRVLPPELQTLVESYTATGRFKLWVDDLTNKEHPNAWGGYMDAGDWDRRADHVLMPLMMFDLEEMFPETFAQWKFNISDSDDNLPDLINEAVWLVDFLRRMQQEDGSVYAAIESGEHPRRGENSWQETLPVFAYSRTPGSAYNYVAVGARAAYWFKKNNMTDKAQGYEESVLKAWTWAESQKPVSNGRERGEDARCLAASELYRLTGDSKYNDIFLATTRFKESTAPFYFSPMGANGDPQGQAGWTYLRTTRSGVSKDIQKNIYNAMLRDADRMTENCETNDFKWAGAPNRLIRWGALSMPESHAICRAHFLTGNEKYLRAVVLSTLTGAGANPVNMCFVTRVGSRWPSHPLHEDSRNTGQPLYEGITIGGPWDPKAGNKPPTAARYEALLFPALAEWPTTETFYDVFNIAPMNEYTVHQTMLPTSFVWGYLAARK